MKKLLCLILCLLLMLTAAAAETLESWNEGSGWRIAADTPVWNTPADAQSGAAALMTLPRGTMVRLLLTDGGWAVIDYYAGGTVRSGAVSYDAVQTADGSALPERTPVPTAIPLATAAPRAAYTATDDSGLLTSTDPIATPAPTAGNALMVTAEVDGLTVEARVITLGSCTSLVDVDGEEVTVSTRTITCREGASNHQIAAITAPKGGTATLRAEPNSKAATVTKLSDGLLVCVLAENGDFCKVSTGDVTGYVTASVLNYDVLQDKIVGTGILCSSSGKTTGNEVVNIRAAAKKAATRTYEWQVGTEVTVLQTLKGWYLVEYNGARGYVNASFIKLNK